MKKAKKSQSYTYTFPGTKIFRDTTALPFADGGPLNDRNLQGELLQSTYAPPVGNMFREGGPFGEDQGAFDYAQSVYAPELGNYYAQGGMIKRADGSYSHRGLWDNIRANAGSGKKPTKEMFAQEKKINNQYREGGQFPRPYSLPEDSFKQGGRDLHNSVYASSDAQYPAVYNFGGTLHNNLATRQQMYMPLDHITRNGGSILSMSNTPELSGEGKDLTVPDNVYYYANGGTMERPWLNNLYPNGGGLFQRWRNRNQAIETPVQNLPEVTVYGNTESAEQQRNLMLKLEEMRRAFSAMRKESGYGAGSLDTKQKGSIGGLKHNIQIYKKALEEQKAISAKAQKALNVLQKHDPENWNNKTVRDVIENPQAVNSLRKLYANDKISEGTFRDFYNNFGKWTDPNVKEGRGGENYSAKEAREEWGKSEHWKDFTDKVNTVATAIPLLGAAGSIVNPGSLSLLTSNPYVSGAMNAYGLYNLPHSVKQTYNEFDKGNYGWGTANALMTAADAIPLVGGVRYAKNLVPGVKNVIGGKANVSDLFKPADLMQLRKEFAQTKINNNQYDSPTMGRYYGDINDIDQVAYWPTKTVTDPITLEKIEKPLEEAYMRTKLGGTKASVADKRIDNLESEGLWTSYITNPDGTIKSAEEIKQLLSDLHTEDNLLKAEKQNIQKKIASGYKNKEFIGRLPLIESRQKSIYKLLDDAAAYEAPKQSIPRPEEFDDAVKRVLDKGINGKKVNLSEQDISMLRYISNHHSDYFSNPEIQQTVDQIFTKYPHIKEIKESRPFSSQSEYILPVGKKPPKISYEEFLKSMGTHDDRAVLNNYLRRHPDKKYSPYVLATEANLMRNNLLQTPAVALGNIAYHAAPYTNQETIPYFGYKANSSDAPTVPFEDELYNLDNINMREADAVKTYMPNPWNMSNPNIMVLPKLP